MDSEAVLIALHQKNTNDGNSSLTAAAHAAEESGEGGRQQNKTGKHFFSRQFVENKRSGLERKSSPESQKLNVDISLRL